MVNGVTLSSEGMHAASIQQEIIANNLANLNTTGFKGGKVFLRMLENPEMNQPVLEEQEVFDFTQGALKSTGNTYDFALEGPGFFVVQAAEGLRFTRNGAFSINADGFLVSSDGAFVMGESGPIQADGEVSVGANGEIYQNGEFLDSLRVVDFVHPYRLQKIHASQFVLADASSELSSAQSSVVKQGYLEQSNVNAIREMVAMMNVFRAFEADAKALKVQDEATGRTINDVGQVR